MGEEKEVKYDFLLKKICFALAYVRKKQYLCREKCSFAKIAGENVLKNIDLRGESERGLYKNKN